MIFTVFSMVSDIDLAQSNINSDIYLPSSRTPASPASVQNEEGNLPHGRLWPYSGYNDAQ